MKKESNKLSLLKVTPTRESIIKDSCIKHDLTAYMSRYYPENVKTLLWSIILYHGNYVGHIWIENYDKIIDGHKLGIAIWEESCRGLGIGTWAIKTIISNFSEAGYDKPIILNVRSNNERAIRCYNNVGFITVDRSIKKNGKEEISLKRMVYVCKNNKK